MRICPKCNREFPDSTLFCPDDGKALVERSGTSDSATDQPASSTTPSPSPAPDDDLATAETIEEYPSADPDAHSPSDAQRQQSPSTTLQDSPPDLTSHSSNTNTPPPAAKSEPPMDTSNLLGQQLFGEYTIVDKLGEGGMGSVYLAQQATIDQKIAVKVLHEDSAEDDEMVKRFHREARVVSMLTHPNIIRVFVFGRTDNGLLYLAMEYVDGTPLRNILDRGMVDEMRAIKIMKQMCSALSEAHDFGIIHRDLKPDNVLLTEWRGEDDFTKILDFGIAKLKQPDSSKEQQKLTKAGVVYGTPEYLSPEQAQAHDLDGRTDLYSLGCMLFEMMTGRLPFESRQPVKILKSHVFDEPPKPSSIAPDRVSPTMDNIIQKAMAKDPDDRFQDGMEFFEALVARERELAREQELEGPGAYVPGMELTGIYNAVDLENAPDSLDTSPTSAQSGAGNTPTSATDSADASSHQSSESTPTRRADPPPATAEQPTSAPSGDNKNIRLIIYLLIAGTGLMFFILAMLIVYIYTVQ